MLAALKAVNAVRTLKEIVMQPGEQWLYVAISDDVTCHHCISKDQQVYSASDELDLLDIFPDLQRISAIELAPRVHMTLWGRDTCRCRLYRYGASEDLPYNKPAEVRRGGYRATTVDDLGIDLSKYDYVKPTQNPIEPLIKQPLEAPEIVKKLPYSISDGQYMDFLDGLLAAGLLSSSVYDLIVNRRKKQKEQKSNGS